jgi:hypothetical protein
MSAREVRVLPAAGQEALEAISWYSERSESAACGFQEEFDIAVAKIGELPQVYPIYMHGAKRCVLQRYPYALVFKEYKAEILVVAVAHLKRKLGYWKNRLKQVMPPNKG